MSSNALPGVNDESGWADAVESWTTTVSDPLLSEHTLLILGEGGGWTAKYGEPLAAMLTLVPTKLREVGLVELASVDDAARPRLWRDSYDDLVSAARSRGFDRLEVIDRGGTLAGPDSITIRSVVRMIHEDSVSGSTRSGVETANKSDVAGILALLKEAFSGHPENGDWSMADIRQRMSQDWYDPSGVFVWRDGPKVQGLCWTKVHPDGVGEIYLVAVSASAAGQGIGKALVEQGVRYLMTVRESPAVIVYSESDNAGALRLYEAVGFRVDRVDSRILLNL